MEFLQYSLTDCSWDDPEIAGSMFGFDRITHKHNLHSATNFQLIRNEEPYVASSLKNPNNPYLIQGDHMRVR